MYVGQDVNNMEGLNGLGAGDNVGDRLKKAIDAFGNKGGGDYSVESILDKRFAVKEIVLYGVLGYIGLRLFRNWRGR